MADSVSSTSSYSYLQTANKRLSGLSSGMDIDSIVEKLMKAESAKMEKLQQQKQKYEWQRDAYREIDLKLETFSKNLFDQFGLQKSLLVRKTSVSDESKVSVTADNTAVGTLNLSSVSQLATSASKLGSQLMTSAINGQHKLSDFGINGSSEGTGSFTIKLNGEDEGKTITYTKDDTIDTLLSKLKDAGLTNAKITNGKLSLGSDSVIVENNPNFFMKLGFSVDGNTLSESNEEATINIKANSATLLKDIKNFSETNGSFTLSVIQSDGSMKDTKINYSSSDTIEDLVKSINTSGAGVTVVFGNGQMSITANATGSVAGGAIQIKEDNENLFNVLGFTSGSSKFVANGTNAIYTINGIQKESTSNSIKESGYSITLKQTFNQANDPNYNGTVTISSSIDTDGMVEKIKSFVNMYNEIIESINTPLKEKKNLNYPPLTDAQKAEMTEEQIKKWEEKAKQGLLRNDTILSTALSGMRNAIYTVSENNPFKGLFNIGVTTTATYTDGGKLQLDEDKLKEAIAKDPEAVVKLFTDSENGVVAKLRTAVDTASKQIDDKAGKSSFADNTYSLGRTISSLDDQIEAWKDRLKAIEERYYNQFTRMEEAINKANMQSSLFMPSY